MEADKTPPFEPCAICGGSGELREIDEEVGCCVVVPCWSCRGATVTADKEIAG
jgi:hypothetical protein